MKLKTWDEIDLLVESDTLALRDYAWELTMMWRRISGDVQGLSISKPEPVEDKC